jgi:putative ATPase
MPEARITLAQAVIALSLAPKSNAVITAVDAALADVNAGKIGSVPAHLRDAHYAGAKKISHGAGYQYAHDDPRGVAPQRHAPDAVEDETYYRPSGRGAEAEYAVRLERIKAILDGEDGPHPDRDA